MKRLKRFLKSPKATVITFALAVVLLLLSSIGGTRAALTYFSETYASRVQMSNIGVTLMEKGHHDKKAEPVSMRDYSDSSNGTWSESTGALLEGMLAEEEELVVGKKYNEELSVKNTGDIDQYVRVSIYKYWIDADAKTEKGEKPPKMRGLDPGLIDLHLVNTNAEGGNGVWLVDESASTRERTVLYYSKVLKTEQVTEPFTDTLKINEMIASKVTQEVSKNGNYTTIKTVYDYDGVKFCVEAKVDAVQDHNAEDAIWSAWGRRVTVENEILSLN
ncbi:MAG: hypothetical protein HFG93_13275 [Dorea sp.]|nr:hypothetical protein [Dorea sp.]